MARGAKEKKGGGGTNLMVVFMVFLAVAIAGVVFFIMQNSEF